MINLKKMTKAELARENENHMSKNKQLRIRAEEAESNLRDRSEKFNAQQHELQKLREYVHKKPETSLVDEVKRLKQEMNAEVKRLKQLVTDETKRLKNQLDVQRRTTTDLNGRLTEAWDEATRYRDAWAKVDGELAYTRSRANTLMEAYSLISVANILTNERKQANEIQNNHIRKLRTQNPVDEWKPSERDDPDAS